MIRSFLDENVAVPSFAFILDGFPRDPGGRAIEDLPWRPRLSMSGAQTRKQVNSYARRRRLFFDMQENTG